MATRTEQNIPKYENTVETLFAIMYLISQIYTIFCKSYIVLVPNLKLVTGPNYGTHERPITQMKPSTVLTNKKFKIELS